MSTENAPGKNPTADATGSPADAPPVAELRSEAPVTPTRTDQQGRSIGGIARVFQVQAFQILLVLLFIYIVFSALAPATFPGWSNQRQVIQNAAILAILGIGMTYVIITSGIDLSVGSVLVFSGVIAAKTMHAIGG